MLFNSVHGVRHLTYTNTNVYVKFNLHYKIDNHHIFQPIPYYY